MKKVNIKEVKQLSLFPDEYGDSSVTKKCGKSQNIKEWALRKKKILNKHLLEGDEQLCGEYQLPQILPYTGDVPDNFVPYNACVNSPQLNTGVHCMLDDPTLLRIWNRPYEALKKFEKFQVSTGPDFTLWADGSVCENIEQLRRNRVITRFAQNHGLQIIQSISWGDAQSVNTYSFDGLAHGSWSAVSHQKIGNKSERSLFKYAITSFVKRFSPIGLIVIGFPLDFEIDVPVKLIPSHIERLRKLR